MDIHDDELMTFDRTRLAAFDPQRSAELLAGEGGELYRNHLVIARWLEGFAARLADHHDDDDEHGHGFEAALRDVAAHLRQADLVPGGVLYDEEMATLSR